MYHIFSLFSFSSKELKSGELTTTRRDDVQPPARKQKWPISSHSPVRRCRRIKRSYISKKSKRSRRQGTSWTIFRWAKLLSEFRVIPDHNSSNSWSGSSIKRLLNNRAITFHLLSTPQFYITQRKSLTKTTKTLGLTFKTKYLRSYHVICHLFHFVLTYVSPLINTTRTPTATGTLV